MYPLDSICRFPPITKIHKGLLDRHLIALLHQVNIIQIVNKVIQIHNSTANNICNLLADQSIYSCTDRKRIKGVHNINILVKDSTPIFTKENNYIINLESRNLDKIDIKFMEYSSNEMAHYEHSNHDYNQSKTQSPSTNKYPLLTQFGIPTDVSSPTNRDTIRSILRNI